MRTAIVAVALLLLVATPVAAEQVQYFPLVFNQAAHPPPPIDCYGYSQVPGYDGPPEYPLEVQPGRSYVTCYDNPGCRLGRVGQYGPLIYKCDAGLCESSGVLAGDITILMTNVRIDNRYQDYWLVLTKEQCDGGLCVVTVARFLYPFAPKRYTGGTHIAALPPNIVLGEANGFGLWRPAVGVEAWQTFWEPCTQYAGTNQPEQWAGRTLLNMGDDPGITILD